jgi:hypothetical protein
MEFFAVLCTVELRKALNSNITTFRGLPGRAVADQLAKHRLHHTFTDEDREFNDE